MKNAKSSRLASLCAIGLSFLCASLEAWASGTFCSELSAEQQQTKRELFSSLHPYGGCDETFERCLAQKTPHPLVLRLANDICRQIKAGKGRGDIERGLSKRAQSALLAIKPATFALDESTLAGDSKAPVRVVVYACARCPFCKVIVPALYKEVTEGVLKGKVHLYFRPFPLKDHPGSLEGGLGMFSASKLGKFWPFLLGVYARYDQFCPKLLPEWAAEAGMDRASFERELVNPQIRGALIASKQEGIRNKVDATPTLFIDGRKYVYEMRQDVILDVLEESYEASLSSRR